MIGLIALGTLLSMGLIPYSMWVLLTTGIESCYKKAKRVMWLCLGNALLVFSINLRWGSPRLTIALGLLGFVSLVLLVVLYRVLLVVLYRVSSDVGATV